MKGSTGLSTSSSSCGWACCWTSIDVAVTGRGNGLLESTRLNRFAELLRMARTGLRITLCNDALSAAGADAAPWSADESSTLEGLLPMATTTTGVFGSRLRGLGCGIWDVVAPQVLVAQIVCLSSGRDVVVRPLVLDRRRSAGRWVRKMREGEECWPCGAHAVVVVVNNVAASCVSSGSWKVRLVRREVESCSVCASELLACRAYASSSEGAARPGVSYCFPGR